MSECFLVKVGGKGCFLHLVVKWPAGRVFSAETLITIFSPIWLMHSHLWWLTGPQVWVHGACKVWGDGYKPHSVIKSKDWSSDVGAGKNALKVVSLFKSSRRMFFKRYMNCKYAGTCMHADVQRFFPPEIDFITCWKLIQCWCQNKLLGTSTFLCH